MAGKLAISYYYDVMRGCSGPAVHKSGKEAVEEIERAADANFNMPVIKKKKLRLTKDGAVTIGYAMRYFIARFLDDEEVNIYNKYKDESMFSQKTYKLIKPEDED